MPLPQDTSTIQTIDSLAQKDSIVEQNYLLEAGKEILNVFLTPSQKLYEGVPIDHTENIWQFGFLLSMILLLAVLRASFSNRMFQFTNAVLVTRQLRQLMREEGFLYHPFSIFLLINSGIIYSLFIYKSILYFEWFSPEGSGFLFYLKILTATFSILILKIMTLRLMEFLTDTDLGQRENRYTWVLFHQAIGIILLPLVAIMLFGKAFWITPCVILIGTIFIISLIFRIGKGILIANGLKVYFMHIFLYLCALEIIPFIVLIKVLITQMNGFNE